MPDRRSVEPGTRVRGEGRPSRDAGRPRAHTSRPHDDQDADRPRPREEDADRSRPREEDEDRPRAREEDEDRPRAREEGMDRPRGHEEDEDTRPRKERSRVERRRPAGMDAAEAGEAGIRHLAALTTKDIDGITSVEPEEDGWVVDVEVVEDRRVPSSGDILAIYEVKIDTEGSLLSYRRLRRYRRANTDSGQAF
ncbi:gas vesicle protein GvpO [Nonomuraea sp. B12E4]|uniref:gas vesicle protein GvpO n=1 Tax=Nonomuraea sp. B12E4 TaxID=3153564 RepID=UPI00325CA6C0